MKNAIALLSLLLCIGALAKAQNGILDVSFGNSSPAGTAIFPATSAGNFEQAIAFQTDGMILVSAGTEAGLARLTTAGAVDATFGGGWVSAGLFSFGDIIVQADGKILAAGRPTNISHNDLYVWRLTSAGTFDNAFGVNGRVGDSSIGAGYERIAVQSGNKIILSGSLGVKRLNMADGSLDASFGNSGFVRIAQLPLNPIALAVDNATGNIVLGGLTKGGSHLAITRLTPNGQVDASFGTNGVDSLAATFTGLSLMMRLGFNSSGKIILVSDYDSGTANRIMCVGFNSNGTVDNSFGNSSVYLPAWNMSGGYLFSGGMAIAGDDKIYIAATINDNGVPANSSDIAIQRLNANGSADGSYGIAKLDVTHSTELVQAIGVEPDGKLVVNGATSGKELVARFKPGTTGISEYNSNLSRIAFYPNPAKGSATLSFAVKAPVIVSVHIYTMDGRQVSASLIDDKVPAGVFSRQIKTEKLIPGTYHLVINAGDETRQLTFSKL